MTFDAELARTFAEDTHDRYLTHFRTLLLQCLDIPEQPVSALDLSCGIGSISFPLLDALPDGSRIVAVTDDRFALRELQKNIEDRHQQHLFARKDTPERLPFAPGVFDLAWLCLPTNNSSTVRAVIRSGLRVLRNGGQLAICVPTHGSFLDLVSALDDSSREQSRPRGLQRLLANRESLDDVETWQRRIAGCGGQDIQVAESNFTLQAKPPLSDDRLFALHLLPLWLGAEPGDPHAETMLETVLQRPVDVEVQIACITARRGPEPLGEEVVSQSN